MTTATEAMDAGFQRLFRMPTGAGELDAPEDPHVLVNGNASVKGTLPINSVDLIVTSPPYNVGMEYSKADDNMSYQDYRAFNRKWLKNCWHWAKDTGRLCVNIGIDKNKNGKHPTASDLTQDALKNGWLYHATILWMEGNLSKGTAWGSWCSASAPHVIAPVEAILVFYKRRWKLERPNGHERISDINADEFKDWVRGVWAFNGENRKPCGHVAAFPPELPARCIKLFSFVGDTVLDPFSGSGTTMMKAAHLGRVAQGIEIDGEMCVASKKRMLNECGLRFKRVTVRGDVRRKAVQQQWETK